MIQQLTNASAMRTIMTIAALGGVAWLGDLVTGQTTSASSVYAIAALVVVSVVVDHLHAIRAQLTAIAQR
jgi:hypothetical protein